MQNETDYRRVVQMKNGNFRIACLSLGAVVAIASNGPGGYTYGHIRGFTTAPDGSFALSIKWSCIETVEHGISPKEVILL